MTTTTETATRTIQAWTVVGERMRQFGYREPNLFLAPVDPGLLGDKDECRQYEADIPASLTLAPNRRGEMCLWDGDERLIVWTNHEETYLYISDDPTTHADTYPLRLAEEAA